MDWSFEAGWDKEHGGLYYFLDAEGFSPTQLEARPALVGWPAAAAVCVAHSPCRVRQWNMKLWWPHSEAMIAFAMAYRCPPASRALRVRLTVRA